MDWKEEMESVVRNETSGGYSHVLMCRSSNSYILFPIFVRKEEDIYHVIHTLIYENSTVSIEKVYNYDLNICDQLLENRPFHIEPCHNPRNPNRAKMEEALEYATLMHQRKYRNDGTEYIIHPIKVAEYVSRFKVSKNIDVLIMAAYLHDTVEDTDATYYDIVERFGPQVAGLVLELTTDEDLKAEIGKTKYLEIKMKNMSSWALVIKLCDRLANICDLENSNEAFRYKCITSTIEILDYVVSKRKLSKTQLTIIKCILQEILILKQKYQLNLFHSSLLKVQNKVKVFITA